MTGVELIVGALAAGAAAGVGTAATNAVTDAYVALRNILTRRMRGSAVVQPALEPSAADPAAWRARIEAALVTSGAAEDEQVLDAARHLLSLTGSDSAGSPAKYRITVNGGQGVQIGDHNFQNITFH